MDAQTFKQLRKQLGLSAREVSERFGYHPAHIGQVECGLKRWLPVYGLALRALANEQHEDNVHLRPA